MSSAVHPLFPPLRLDLNNQRLWQGTNEIQLKPKASALRHYLVEHADRVVTKKELLDTVWADARISERSVKSYIKEIRQVLDDPPRRPHYVQTVHGRGYQFIGPLRPPPPHSRETRTSQRPSTTVTIVGREAEIEQLYGHFEQALQGQRQLVFVSGEARIGKTSVVDAFLEQRQATGDLWVGRGLY